MNDSPISAIKDFLDLLDSVEISDSGKEFSPVSISCCRTEIYIKLVDILTEFKELTQHYEK